MFVASKRPPNPTSNIAISTRALAKCSNASAVTTSKNVGCARNFPCASNSSIRAWILVNAGKLFIRNFHAVYADAFVDFFQMGRGVQSGPESRSSQNRFGKCGGRSLSVCPGDVHAAVFFLGMPQGFCECGDIFEVEFCCGGLRRGGEFPSQRKKILQRFVVIHFSQSGDRVTKRRTLSILCGGRRHREIRARAKIPSAENLLAVFDESSARSRAGRQNQSVRPAPRCSNRRAWRNLPSRRPSLGQSKSKCREALRRRASRARRKLSRAASN